VGHCAVVFRLDSKRVDRFQGDVQYIHSDWIFPDLGRHAVGVAGTQRPEQAAFLPVNMGVTAVVLILGALALGSGLRRRYPRGMRFLGHSRFAGYFMIALFPVQSGYLNWTWQRVAAIVVFAIPVWLLVHLSVMPWRRK